MSSRFIALVALLLLPVVACNQSPIGLGDEVSVNVTVALSASEVGAATLQYWVSHPTELPTPLTGRVGVRDPATSFRLTQLPVATGYVMFIVAYKANGDAFCSGGDAVAAAGFRASNA